MVLGKAIFSLPKGGTGNCVIILAQSPQEAKKQKKKKSSMGPQGILQAMWPRDYNCVLQNKP